MKLDINQILGTDYSELQQLLKSLKTQDNCFVGWVDSYNSTNQTINVQPAVQVKVITQKDTIEYRNRPYLINCWVISNTLNREPKKGDKCLVFVLDEKSNNFFKAQYNENLTLEQQTVVNTSKAYKTTSNCVAIIYSPNAIQIPTKTSDLENDSNFIEQGQDIQAGNITATGNITTSQNITGNILTATGTLNCDTSNVWFGGNLANTIKNSGNNWIEYNNGQIIQIGTGHIERDSSMTLTFPHPFLSTNYSIVILDGNNNDKNNYINGYRLNGNKSTSSVSIWKSGAESDFDWIAIEL